MRHYIAFLTILVAGCTTTGLSVDSPAIHYRYRSDQSVGPEDHPADDIAGTRSAIGESILAALPLEKAEIANETSFYIVHIVDESEGVDHQVPGFGELAPVAGVVPYGSTRFPTCKCGWDESGMCRVVLPGTDESQACRHKVKFEAWRVKSVAGHYMPTSKVVGCAWNTLSPRSDDMDHNRITIRTGDIGRGCI
jgi:hypothetical protein